MSVYSTTLAGLKTHMKHAIGGNPDANSDLTDIANRALYWLCDYHPWTWLLKAISLDFTNAQNYIALPADFKAFHTLARNSTFVPLIPTTLHEIHLRRVATGISTGLATFYAISVSPQASSTAVPLYRLEIYPTPTDDATGAIIGTYIHLVPALSGDTDVPEIPPPWHPALISVCRAMARSDQMQAGDEDWAQALKLLEQLKNVDGSAQPSLGVMRGAVNMRRECDGPVNLRGSIVTP